MLYKFFTETQEYHGVTSKDLAEAAGVSRKHLSEFRRGKANISLDLLWHLVETLEQLSPGARRDFGLRLAGLEGSLTTLVEQMPPEELSDTLLAISQSLRKSLYREVDQDKESVAAA